MDISTMVNQAWLYQSPSDKKLLIDSLQSDYQNFLQGLRCAWGVNSDNGVFEFFVEFLHSWAGDSDIKGHCLQALDEDEVGFRVLAARALEGANGRKEVVARLIIALRGDLSMLVRGAAASSLAPRVARPEVRAAFVEVLEGFSLEIEGTKRQGEHPGRLLYVLVKALANQASEDDIKPHILEFLQSEDETLRGAVVLSLSEEEALDKEITAAINEAVEKEQSLFTMVRKALTNGRGSHNRRA